VLSQLRKLYETDGAKFESNHRSHPQAEGSDRDPSYAIIPRFYVPKNEDLSKLDAAKKDQQQHGDTEETMRQRIRKEARTRFLEKKTEQLFGRMF